MIRQAFIAGILLATIAARAVHGQEAPGSVVIDHHDLELTAGAIGATALLTHYDVRIARAFTDSAFHRRHPGLTTAAKRASLVTETVLMGTSGAMWGVGRLTKSPAMADVSLHTFESVASAAMFIQVVRGILGRARPYVVGDSGDVRDADPYEFQPLHGFTSFNYRSFPSMHAMASFAAATAMVQEMRVRNTPGRQVYGPLLYAGATMPSLARMYLDEHWTSDIAMGVFLGILSGQKVVRYSHEHPTNIVDRKLLPHQVRIGLTRDARGLSLSLLPF